MLPPLLKRSLRTPGRRDIESFSERKVTRLSRSQDKRMKNHYFCQRESKPDITPHQANAVS